MNPICFYHKSDLDGVCSAAIVKRFVPDCELYGVDYGEEFPWELAAYKATHAREVSDDPARPNKWKVSLYSTKPEIDCGAIAKTYGGGGHVGAAGFVCNRLPWEG